MARGVQNRDFPIKAVLFPDSPCAIEPVRPVRDTVADKPHGSHGGVVSMNRRKAASLGQNQYKIHIKFTQFEVEIQVNSEDHVVLIVVVVGARLGARARTAAPAPEPEPESEPACDGHALACAPTRVRSQRSQPSPCPAAAFTAPAPAHVPVRVRVDARVARDAHESASLPPASAGPPDYMHTRSSTRGTRRSIRGPAECSECRERERLEREKGGNSRRRERSSGVWKGGQARKRRIGYYPASPLITSHIHPPTPRPPAPDGNAEAAPDEEEPGPGFGKRRNHSRDSASRSTSDSRSPEPCGERGRGRQDAGKEKDKTEESKGVVKGKEKDTSSKRWSQETTARMSVLQG
ncbi:hypothetical protein B0H14DRAFT_3148693 [Mycena olivaceomarginata]|nr:hypothetical protein B0H14DRAFT_3148693 [Mycena olivaceomarginata]